MSAVTEDPAAGGKPDRASEPMRGPAGATGGAAAGASREARKLPEALAARLETASRTVAAHRRQSVSNELAICIDELAQDPASAAARDMAETLAEIRALIVEADERRVEQ